MYSSKVQKLFHSIWAIPLLIILRLFVQFVSFKIVCLRADRIGHFPMDSAEAICRAQKTNDFRIYCLSSKPVNEQWYKMLAQKLVFCNCLHYVYFFEKRLFKDLRVCEYGTLNQSRDILGNFYHSKFSQLEFSDEDKKVAHSWLRQQGIGFHDKFICLLVRDDAYMKTHITNKHQDFSYHDYRDSQIETYSSGIRYLLDEGYWVIRMGRKTNNELNIDHSRWIDYSQTSTIQSDLMDIWLFANCEGCISTATGPDVIPAIYNRPLCFVNVLPASNLWSFCNALCAPKRLFHAESNQELNWNETLSHTYYQSDLYRKKKIKIVDLTEKEITELFQEFHLHMKNELKYEKNMANFELSVIEKLLTDKECCHLHGWVHPNFKFSSSFLNTQMKLD